MKEYMKPEVEYVDFAAEAVMSDNMGGNTASTDVNNPFA